MKTKFSGDKNPMYMKSVLDIWINKYGYEIATQMWDEKKMKQSIIMQGEKNPMYKKSILDVWVKKYGYEIAEIKYNKWINNLKKSLKLFYVDDYITKKKISNKLKGRVFTDIHKKNLRISTINHIKKRCELNGNIHAPAFNIFACNLFDEISKILNVNIKHALNGGEYYIDELGYWVDGYDIDNNIVYEYYEKFHKYKIERDNKREYEIKNLLKCDLVVIWEGNEDEFIENLKNRDYEI